jgi:hypothetical protein
MTPDDYPFGGLRQVRLDEIRVGQRMRVSTAFARLDLSIDENPSDLIAGQLTAKLEARVYAAKQPPTKVDARRTYTYDVPRTWWDHWKIAHTGVWYAKWWINRHPARMLTKTLNVHVAVPINPAIAFPDAPIPASRYGEPICMVIVDEPSWDLEADA